jgi:hypothetical protein
MEIREGTPYTVTAKGAGAYPVWLVREFQHPGTCVLSCLFGECVVWCCSGGLNPIHIPGRRAAGWFGVDPPRLRWLVALGALSRGASDGADREVLARAGDGADREVLARSGGVGA